MRNDDRPNGTLRPVSFELGYTRYAEGSVLCSFGETKVLCNATVEERQPPFLKGSDEGWVTAEYALLPRATHTRNAREAKQGRQKGRTLEIQRLIGRSLRGVVNRKKLGPRTIVIDCDVIQADGGTRTASITGGFVALSLAVSGLLSKGLIKENPIREAVAAISCGILDDERLLDLSYEEDHRASVDLNLVGTESGGIIEVQGTSENEFVMSRNDLDALLDLGCKGVKELIALQEAMAPKP